ncbi:5-hydroxytryptamine receptor 1E-like [Centroberyx affinis]|uniref:5-hydroxytryptamine receptor 1E-like n=1 Tax=Centroberyx affinis TaxID=166261 RepID=UPI003A5BBE94
MERDTLMIFVVFFLSIITLFAALLNIGVILVFSTTKKLHLPANYLICSLAVTDLLVAILVMPLSVLYIATERWLLGVILCEAWLSIDMTCCTCSILHLCAIALDRHWAITNALVYAHKRTQQWVVVMITVVWTVSILITMPPLFWRRILRNNNDSVDAEVPKNVSDQCFIKHDHVGYTIYSTCGAFYIPMALILILYYRIFVAARAMYHKRREPGALWNKKTAGSNKKLLCRSNSTKSEPELPALPLNTELNKLSTPCFVAQKEAMKQVKERIQTCASRERKAALVLGLILGAFILCWLPFFVKELLLGFNVLQPSSQVSVLSDILTWLGYTNSLINPLLYTTFNEDFKQAFKRLLSCKSCK